jgi:hypothetical protein
VFRDVVGIELHNEVIGVVPHRVVEVGEVSFLAPGSSGPGWLVVLLHTVAAADLDSVGIAPAARLVVRTLVGEPRVVRMVLSEHADECPPDHEPRL